MLLVNLHEKDPSLNKGIVLGQSDYFSFNNVFRFNSDSLSSALLQSLGCVIVIEVSEIQSFM